MANIPCSIENSVKNITSKFNDAYGTWPINRSKSRVFKVGDFVFGYLVITANSDIPDNSALFIIDPSYVPSSMDMSLPAMCTTSTGGVSKHLATTNDSIIPGYYGLYYISTGGVTIPSGSEITIELNYGLQTTSPEKEMASVYQREYYKEYLTIEAYSLNSTYFNWGNAARLKAVRLGQFVILKASFTAKSDLSAGDYTLMWLRDGYDDLIPKHIKVTSNVLVGLSSRRRFETVSLTGSTGTAPALTLHLKETCVSGDWIHLQCAFLARDLESNSPLQIMYNNDVMDVSEGVKLVNHTSSSLEAFRSGGFTSISVSGTTSVAMTGGQTYDLMSLREGLPGILCSPSYLYGTEFRAIISAQHNTPKTKGGLLRFNRHGNMFTFTPISNLPKNTTLNFSILFYSGDPELSSVDCSYMAAAIQYKREVSCVRTGSLINGSITDGYNPGGSPANEFMYWNTSNNYVFRGEQTLKEVYIGMRSNKGFGGFVTSHSFQYPDLGHYLGAIAPIYDFDYKTYGEVYTCIKTDSISYLCKDSEYGGAAVYLKGNLCIVSAYKALYKDMTNKEVNNFITLPEGFKAKHFACSGVYPLSSKNISSRQALNLWIEEGSNVIHAAGGRNGVSEMGYSDFGCTLVFFADVPWATYQYPFENITSQCIIPYGDSGDYKCSVVKSGPMVLASYMIPKDTTIPAGTTLIKLPYGMKTRATKWQATGSATSLGTPNLEMGSIIMQPDSDSLVTSTIDTVESVKSKGYKMMIQCLFHMIW